MVAGPVAPGSGWPDDPASPGTPVAASAGNVRDLASGAASLAELTARQSVCRACPRLVEWREQVAAVRRKSFRDEQYWGRPIAGWGDPAPAILIVGLAPAAHGGNRTGRIFTGDRSGDFLFASLHRCGLASQETSVSAGDGQRLIGARMVATVRCAPPDNKPTPAERDTCAPWLTAELRMTAASLRLIVCLGGFAWQALWPVLADTGYAIPRPRPAFAHGAEVELRSADGTKLLLIGCYHPSQQNTFTGRVTGEMFDAIFSRARLIGSALRSPACIRPWPLRLLWLRVAAWPPALYVSARSSERLTMGVLAAGDRDCVQARCHPPCAKRAVRPDAGCRMSAVPRFIVGPLVYNGDQPTVRRIFAVAPRDRTIACGIAGSSAT